MKKIKYIFVLILVIIIGYILYIINNYYEYEQKQKDVNSFKQLAQEAFFLKMKGYNKKAIPIYEEAFKIYDKEHTSLADAADLYRKEGNIKKAKKLYYKAFEVQNNRYSYLENQALCEYLLKEYDRSIKSFKKLLNIDKNSPTYYKFLSLNYYAKGDKSKSFGYYGSIANLQEFQKDKLLIDIKKEYDSLENKPKPLKVVYKYNQTNDIKKLETLLEKYKKDGYSKKAVRTAQKILSIDPNNDIANKAAAELYLSNGVNAQAYKYSLKVIQHDANSLLVLGSVYQNIGQYEKALESYEKSYSKKPNKQLLRAMVVTATKAKKLEDMNIYISRLNKIDPLLTTKLIYALEIENKIKHSFWDKFVYLTKLEFYEILCKIKGCEVA